MLLFDETRDRKKKKHSNLSFKIADKDVKVHLSRPFSLVTLIGLVDGYTIAIEWVIVNCAPSQGTMSIS